MLTKVHVDNYKCMSNFTIEPKGFQLWLGDNGSGKTTVLEILQLIQGLMQGGNIQDLVSDSTLTAWDTREKQHIGVGVKDGGDRYEYDLTLDQSRKLHKVRICREELKWNGATFYLFEGTEAHLYRINRETNQPEFGTSFAADWSRSLIHAVAERDDNWPLLRFRELVCGWLLIQPIPMLFRNVAESESRQLSRHGENFADWYRYVVQERPSVAFRAKQQLEEVLPDLDEIGLKESGNARRLVVTFRSDGKDFPLDFSDLSDGQRQLIALYTVLESLRAGLFTAAFIDEPDNFMSLREIQPWVVSMREVSEENDTQAILISHHPEIINHMALGEELWFSRHRGGQVVVRPLATDTELPPAEIVARGWEGE